MNLRMLELQENVISIQLTRDNTLDEFIAKHKLSVISPLSKMPVYLKDLLISNSYLNAGKNLCVQIVDLNRTYENGYCHSNCSSCILNIHNKREFWLLADTLNELEE